MSALAHFGMGYCVCMAFVHLVSGSRRGVAWAMFGFAGFCLVAALAGGVAA